MTTSAITFLRVVKVATENNSKLLHSLRGLLLTFGRDYKLNYTQGPAGPGEGQQAGQHWGGQERAPGMGPPFSSVANTQKCQACQTFSFPFRAISLKFKFLKHPPNFKHHPREKVLQCCECRIKLKGGPIFNPCLKASMFFK